ncbi:MAG: S41 family peptidase [Candidatus Coprenecus sp.]|nr:S41 family peptidase [Candidatus Coprenecus sp.]
MKKFLKSIAVITVVLLSQMSMSGQSKNFETGRMMEIQAMILRTLESQYVDSIQISKLLKVGIDKMLETLDPYTVFVPEEDEEALEMMSTGSYGGVGAMIQKTPSGPIMITEVYAGSAAIKSGLEPGDLILAVDGTSTDSLTVSQTSSKMRGRASTTVRLKVQKGRTGATEELAVTRDVIHVSDVVYAGMVNDTTGIITIGGFTYGGAKEVREAVISLKERGMKRLILDLRGNGGGLMAEAVDILSIFLPKGTHVITSRGKNPEMFHEYFTEKQPVDTDIPLMVLIDSGSASSSEIVAGALQDLDRAVIAGSRSYGKGLVQSISAAGYGSSLKFTSAKYYIPSGRCVQAIDYSNRNENGSVGTVPDSLKREFKTLSGRVVYDGGGITPDLEFEPRFMSRAFIALLFSGAPDNFAIEYYKKHPSIAPADEFVLSDSEYDDFVSFASQVDFDVRTQTEIELEALIEKAQKEKVFQHKPALQEQMKGMLDSLCVSKKDFLYQNKDLIRSLLQDEIAEKYYLKWGSTQSSIRWDELIFSAMEKWDNVKLK